MLNKRLNGFFYGFIVVLFAVPELVFSQNAAEKLKQSREKTMKEIEYANKLLQETQGKTKQSLNEINIINHRLSKRKEYLIGLEVEVNVISQDMEKNMKEIAKSEQEISRIKDIYSRMLLNLYKNKTAGYQAMYFLAAENVNQLYKRIHTVKLYNSFLRKERNRLEELKSDLQAKNNELVESRKNKDAIVSKTKIETVTIQREMNEKSRLVKQLKKRQKEIEDDIRNKERTAKKLESELKKIIDEERRVSKAKGNKEMMTPAERIVSADFAKNNGSLPWPTEKGIITGKYGEHQHPDYKNVTVRNDGVYISTSAGENARSIFKGVISRVFSIPGENYTVIIKHGQYFSLYHNLVNVKVKPGQAVNTKEAIGTVFTDTGSKETVLYFQIWKETERSDPEIWLAPLQN